VGSTFLMVRMREMRKASGRKRPDVQAYDTTTRTWSRVPAMSTSRLNLAAASLPGQVYAIGGAGPLANHEVFNPAGGNWTALASLPTARESLGGATGPDGLSYAIGGQDGSDALTTVEVFDVATGPWSTTTSLPSACWSLAAAVGPDGLVYAYGGLANDGFPLSTMYGYNPATKTWTTQDAMLTPQASLAGVTGPDGLIYAIGGQNFVEPALNTMEAFTTGTPLTSPDPYIGNGTYRTPDIILLDASNTPIHIGGAPGGAWDTLLVPNTNYGLQTIVYNDSTVPATGTVVAFWHFSGVGTSGALIDQQTVTVPANGSLVVTSASPFVSGPAGARVRGGHHLLSRFALLRRRSRHGHPGDRPDGRGLPVPSQPAAGAAHRWPDRKGGQGPGRLGGARGRHRHPSGAGVRRGRQPGPDVPHP
jgi:hypothetical protein